MACGGQLVQVQRMSVMTNGSEVKEARWIVTHSRWTTTDDRNSADRSRELIGAFTEMLWVKTTHGEQAEQTSPGCALVDGAAAKNRSLRAGHLLDRISHKSRASRDRIADSAVLLAPLPPSQGV